MRTSKTWIFFGVLPPGGAAREASIDRAGRGAGGTVLLPARDMSVLGNESFWKRKKDATDACEELPAANASHDERERRKSFWEPIAEPLLRGPKLCLEPLRINLLQVKSIDQVAQSFKARVFIQLVIRGGALDSELSRKDDVFPATGRPSALWYLKQIHFPNAANLTWLEAKVVPMASSHEPGAPIDDLHIVLRADGEFYQRMELHHFPVDSQQLSVICSLNCANEGSVPVFFETSDKAMALSVDLDNFTLTNSWVLRPNLDLAPTTVQPMAGRSYPGLKISAHVERRPMYYAFNVVLPMATLAIMSNLIFLVPLSEGGDRLQISFGLMLSCVTYKFIINDILPTIAYLTLIDKYVFAANGLVVVNVFTTTMTTAVVADEHWTELAGLSRDAANSIDLACFLFSLLLWLSLHLFFGGRVLSHYRRARREREHEAQRADEASGVAAAGQTSAPQSSGSPTEGSKRNGHAQRQAADGQHSPERPALPRTLSRVDTKLLRKAPKLPATADSPQKV